MFETLAEQVKAAEARGPQERTWDIPFFCRELEPNKAEKMDTQPKCLFRVEKIVAASNEDLHLLGLYVGNKEILGLNGDSIPLNGKTIVVDKDVWSDPAFTVKLEVINRGKTARMVDVVMYGTARV
jgi:hypothetical protein